MRVKIILVGDSGVGKTSLVTGYLGCTFAAQTTSTTAPVFFSIDIPIEGATISAEIWDTAGQERYRSMMSLYYRGARAALLCASKESLDSVSAWVEDVRKVEENAKIVLVVTKADLYSPDEFDDIANAAEAIRKELGLQEVVLTSTKDGTGVTEAFAIAARWVSISKHPHPLPDFQPSPKPDSCC
jgi:small GTP-binding protein